MALNPHEELMTAALNKRAPSMKAMKALFTPPPPVTPPVQFAGDVVPFSSSKGTNDFFINGKPRTWDDVQAQILRSNTQNTLNNALGVQGSVTPIRPGGMTVPPGVLPQTGVGPSAAPGPISTGRPVLD